MSGNWLRDLVKTSVGLARSAEIVGLGLQVARVAMVHGADPPKEQAVRLLAHSRRCGGLFEVLAVLAAGTLGYESDLSALPNSGQLARDMIAFEYVASIVPIGRPIRNFAKRLTSSLGTDVMDADDAHESTIETEVSRLGYRIIEHGLVTAHFHQLDQGGVCHIRRVPDSVTAWATATLRGDALAAMGSLSEVNDVRLQVRLVTEHLVSRLKPISRIERSTVDLDSVMALNACIREVGETLGIVYAASHIGRYISELEGRRQS